MVLLAIQTSLQPRLSKRYISSKTSNVKVALTEEIIKASVAATTLVLCSSGSVAGTTSPLLFQGVRHVLKGTNCQRVNPAFLTRISFGCFLTSHFPPSPTLLIFNILDWTLASCLIGAGIPAILYAIQGVLTYQSHQHLDSVTFNGLSQTKTLTAALGCFLVLGQRQSPLQMVALALLFVSALLFQSPSKPVTANATTRTSTINTKNHAFLIQGVLPCLGATLLSGLAGAFSQRGLQIVGGNGRNALVYTVEVSFCSALTLLVGLGLKRIAALSPKSSSQPSPNNAVIEESKTDDSWTWQTYIPITCKALGGILTALVHKHAGSVVKGFALMLGLVMSGILQTLWLDNAASNDSGSAATDAPTTKTMRPQKLSTQQVCGIVIVMFSSWLHFTNPPT